MNFSRILNINAGGSRSGSGGGTPPPNQPDLREQVRLQREANRLAEEAAQRNLRERQNDINYAQRDLENWRLDRADSSRGLTGRSRADFNRDTRAEDTARQRDLLRDRGSLDDLRQRQEDEKRDRKKQLRLLEQQERAVREEGSRGRDTMSRVMGGASSAMRGDVGGLLASVGVAGGVIGLGTAIFKAVENAESGVKRYSAAAGVSPLFASAYASNVSRAMNITGTLGMTGKEFLEGKVFPASTAFGDDLSKNRGDLALVKGVAAYGRARNLSQGQEESLFGVSRFSGGRDPITMISTMENYLESTRKSLIQLPELLQSYLGTANTILSKTGYLDSRALQSTITSVGKSFNVEGLNMDRMLGGLTKMGGEQSDDFLFAIQQQVLRETYPKMGALDRLGVLQSPLEHKEYIKNLYNRRLSMFGGGETGELGLALSGELSVKDLKRNRGKSFMLSDFEIEEDKKKAAQENVLKESELNIGATEEIKTVLSEGFNTLGILLGNVIKGKMFDNVYLMQTTKAFNAALKENKSVFNQK